MTSTLETEVGDALRILELVEVFPAEDPLPDVAKFTEMADFFDRVPNLCKLVIGRGQSIVFSTNSFMIETLALFIGSLWFGSATAKPDRQTPDQKTT